MKVAGDMGAFLLLGRDEPPGQEPDLFFRLPSLVDFPHQPAVGLHHVLHPQLMSDEH